MDLKLQGKRALVTGSSSGIGAGVARMLAEEGCRVVVHGRDRERTERVAREIGAAGAVIGDIATTGGADSVASSAADAAGGAIDILVNNAGGGEGTTNLPWLDVPEDAWARTFQTNTMGAVRLVRRLVPAMTSGWMGPHHSDIERGRGQADHPWSRLCRFQGRTGEHHGKSGARIEWDRHNGECCQPRGHSYSFRGEMDQGFVGIDGVGGCQARRAGAAPGD